MAFVTFQLIEGLERGRVYRNLPTPVTIGREEENSVQLNDERVSRFHAKIQDDGGRVILTDLDSTNGTRVNGHPVQMRVLQAGDQVAIGRCLLVFGSREQIAERFGVQIDRGSDSGVVDPSERTVSTPDDFGLAFPEAPGDSDLEPLDKPLPDLFPNGPPPPPDGLRPVHRAEVSDFVSYVHEQIRRVLQAAAEVRPETKPGVDEPEDDDARPMQLPPADWQRLLNLEMELAVYMRTLADPQS